MIKVENLNYVYQQGMPYEMHALNDINIEIPDGDFTAIIGHTGSGKSTLIQHFNGLEKPSTGKVYFSGEDIHSDNYDRKTLRGRVGLVFQYPEHQLFEMSIFKDVAFGPKNQGLSENEVNERVREALELVGIEEERFNDSPLDLSGGQKKRVAIAGVLAMKPECIVLDEPTAMLDPQGRREVMETILKLNREKGITVVLITHHMDEAAQAQRVIVLSSGTVAADGTPQEVFSRVELLHSIRLAAPETVELCYELNKQGIKMPLDCLTTEECAQALYDMLKA